MAIVKLYSKQQAAAKNRRRSYRHDEIPKPLRTQILTIFDRCLGKDAKFTLTARNAINRRVQEILEHEYGVYSLIPYDTQNPLNNLWRETVTEFFLGASTNQCLDVIQVTLTVAKEIMANPIYCNEILGSKLDEGIAEINERFREHSIGFQYSDGQIIRINSEWAYQNVTAPALKVLRQNYLKGAQDEFFSAQEHYRHGRYKECLNDCLKAFESTMKAICDKRGWQYDQNDTAKPLISICEKSKLFPVFMENHLSGLRMSLESGVPTARNKTSGHGQGVKKIVVSQEFAAYALNLTGTNILFLSDCERTWKK